LPVGVADFPSFRAEATFQLLMALPFSKKVAIFVVKFTRKPKGSLKGSALESLSLTEESSVWDNDLH
jgi:hypothetical protein